MDRVTGSGTEVTVEQRREIVKWIVQAAIGLVGYALVIFVSAGTLEWIWGWALIGVLGVFLAAHPLILGRTQPDLLVERRKGTRAQGVKRWDKWITSLAGGFMVLSWIVAGLDFRFQWTGPVALIYHLAGLLFMILGYGLFLWAMASNAFFSEGVRIQEERGHAVASSGPYRIVRHPGYAGAIMAHLATPFLLGSIWALIPSLLLAALFVARTILEDRTLKRELGGYEAFSRETQHRLLPLIW